MKSLQFLHSRERIITPDLKTSTRRHATSSFWSSEFPPLAFLSQKSTKWQRSVLFNPIPALAFVIITGIRKLLTYQYDPSHNVLPIHEVTFCEDRLDGWQYGTIVTTTRVPWHFPIQYPGVVWNIRNIKVLIIPVFNLQCYFLLVVKLSS